MKLQDNQNLPDGPNSEQPVALADLLAPAWHARKLIVTVTGIVVVLGLVAALSLAKYRSEGFFAFGGAIPLQQEKLAGEKDPAPGVALSDYKRYAAAFNASGRFDEFARANKLSAQPDVQQLRGVFGSREGITKLVEPVYPFTKLDAKELMEQPKDGSSNIIGLRINFEDASPDGAQRMVALLGRYTMDTILYLTYSDSLRFKHSELASKLARLEDDIIDEKEKLDEYRRKVTTLREIVGRYPDSANQAARQVISVTDENARFLSPVTHLMSTEVQASAANEKILKIGREQRQTQLLMEYFDGAKALVDTSKSGEAILRGLEPIKVNVFKNKDMNDELIKEVFNKITIENRNAITLYLEKSRFIAGPTLPESRSTRLAITLVMSLLAGLLLSLMLVFVRNWWIANRLRIVN